MKKFVLVVPDGMSDEPWGSSETPLEAAETPNLDKLARSGTFGFVRTIPEGFHPGSEIGNMVLLGYDPAKYYTGRGPIEAAAIGVEMEDDDIIFRCNLVTLLPYGKQIFMEDYSAGHIKDEEAAEIIEHLNKFMGQDGKVFFKGKSYRNIMVWKKSPKRPEGIENINMPPPHDLTEKNIFDHLGKEHMEILKLITESQMLLKDHPVNVKRRERGEREANSIWLWGQGRRPNLPPFKEIHGVDGGVISAVDLIKGLAKLSKLDVINVEGATGYIDTNYEGKADAALEFLKDHDFVFVHIEAADEAGHLGDFDLKKKAIEDFDRRFLGRLLEGLRSFPSWRILISPDHPTPLSIKTHSRNPVPFVIFDSSLPGKGALRFSERVESPVMVKDGTSLIDILFERRKLEN